MSNSNVIPPFDQTYLLNKQLIQYADQLTDPVILVGGQAVQYWVAVYHNQYGKELPDQNYLGSYDIDYSAKRNDVQTIAEALNVDLSFNDSGQPPSIASFLLFDKHTTSIKQLDGRFFSDPNQPETPTVVDVIDWPAGFKVSDFYNKNLIFNTAVFRINVAGQEVMHEKVRVLNPIACMRSRFANLKNLYRSSDMELPRINALKIPCVYFILEMFKQEPFRVARQYYMNLYWLAWDKNFLLLQAEYHGVKPDISILSILEKVHQYLTDQFDDFDIPEEFVKQELPRALERLHNRYVRLCEGVNQKESSEIVELH